MTGGGLPAEIWHEVMVRVHEGIPPSPLPMFIPEPRTPPTGATAPGTDPSQPAGADGRQQRQPDMAENILREVLGALQGKN